MRYVSLRSVGLRIFLYIFLCIFLCGFFYGCNDRPKPISEKTSASSSSSSLSSTSAASTACQIFSNNSNDLLLCQGCITSTGSTDLTTLAMCVHANSGVTGGATCVGLTCGSGQTANFATCSCMDSTVSTGFPGQPGQTDQSTPSVFVGLAIGNRYCSAIGCGATTNTSVIPSQTTLTPSNVFTDVGYLRWDLAYDESQYPSSGFLGKSLAFPYSSATMPGTPSINIGLKPNTALSTTTLYYNDCAEHFSGYLDGTAKFQPKGSCDLVPAANRVSMTLSLNGGNWTASVPNISMSGRAANLNLTRTSLSSGGSPYLRLGIGMGKNDSAGTSFPITMSNVGLFSNIGNYKYTFGNLTNNLIEVTKTGSTSTIAKATAAGRFSINANLSFEPVSAVESSAFHPDTVLGNLTSSTTSPRDCTVIAGNNCVITALYRTTGGSIQYQSFSPKLPNSVSAVGTLPMGVIAVSTPKVIEDVSQLETSTSALSKKPARLRAFVRASDGNIYMSRSSGTSWSNWASLGRPWVADNTAVYSACATVGTTSATQYPFGSASSAIHRPYTNCFATQNMDNNAVTLAAAYQTPYSAGNANAGISIVGEPVIASYMDTSSTPHTAYVAIFVRVSQVDSSSGSFGVFGAYHNAVFWTYTKTTSPAAPATGVSTLDLDNISRWSPWMPVVINKATIVQPLLVQGNPSVYMTKIGVKVSAYIISAKAVSVIPEIPGTSYAHAPVAFYNDAAAGTTWYQEDSFSAGGTKNWFNYSSNIIRVGLNFTDNVDPTAVNPGVDITGPVQWGFDPMVPVFPATPPDITDVSTLEVIGAGTQSVIVSDFGIASYAAGKIRVFANTLSGAPLASNFGLILTAFTGTISKIPYAFNRRILLFGDYTLAAPSLVISGITTTIAHGFYGQATQAFGTPHPLYLPLAKSRYLDPNLYMGCDDDVVDSVCDAGTYLSVQTTNARTANSYFLPSRVRCGTETWCPDTYTTFGYTMASTSVTGAPGVPGNDEMHPDHFQYANQYFIGGLFPTQGWIYHALQPVYKIPLKFITSDIIPVYSHALEEDTNDGPVYLFIRDSQGYLNLGTWGSKGEGTSGGQMWQFTRVGGYVN